VFQQLYLRGKSVSPCEASQRPEGSQVRSMRTRLRAPRRPEEASGVLTPRRQVIPLRNLQQDFQGSSAAAHEDACTRSSARLCHMRPAIRSKIPADGAPEDPFWSAAFPLSRLLAGLRSLDRPKTAHSPSHRRTTLQVLRVQRRLYSAAALEEAHEVHTR